MKKIFFIFNIILLGHLSAGPEEAVKEFFQDFNNEDILAINKNSDSPFIYIMGKNTVLEEKYSDVINFNGLKKDGWSYSKINASKVLYNDGDTSMVQVNFSRLDKNNEIILTSDVTYLLVNKDGNWKLKGGFSPNLASLGND
tara:strand:+ start:958 stop:1383 length:426 start_codon:yes stop_codon:yes gene_type:complete